MKFSELEKVVTDPNRRIISGSNSLGFIVTDIQGRVLKTTRDYNDAVLTANSRD